MITLNDYQWTSVNPHAPPADELVRAGFYCVEDNDSVRCWWCSAGLNQWDPGVRPLREHARYSTRGPLLMQLVCRRFVLDVLDERELTPDTSQLVENSSCMRGVLGTYRKFYNLSVAHWLVKNY